MHLWPLNHKFAQCISLQRWGFVLNHHKIESQMVAINVVVVVVGWNNFNMLKSWGQFSMQRTFELFIHHTHTHKRSVFFPFLSCIQHISSNRKVARAIIKAIHCLSVVLLCCFFLQERISKKKTKRNATTTEKKVQTPKWCSF